MVLDLKDYGVLLARLYVLHRHIEASSLQLTEQFSTPALAGCNHSAMIEADLASLDIAVPAELDFVALPLRSGSDVLGALYVIEGSTLGGPTIGRLLHSRLGLTTTTGAASFHPYGSSTADRWSEFCAFLVPGPKTSAPSSSALMQRFAVTRHGCCDQRPDPATVPRPANFDLTKKPTGRR